MKVNPLSQLRERDPIENSPTTTNPSLIVRKATEKMPRVGSTGPGISPPNHLRGSAPYTQVIHIVTVPYHIM